MSKPESADVFVVFGITGDLAKVMTFRSLYRLERRGLLDCPIVGVAVDDWTVDRPARARARVDRGHRGAGRPAVFERFAARLSYVSGDFADAGDVRARRRGDRGRAEAGLLPRDPAVPLRHGGQGALGRRPDEERPRRGREAVRPRPRARPARSPRSCTSTSTSPSSTGSTTTSGRWGSTRSSTSGSRTRCSSRSGTGTTSSAVEITMAEDFGVEDRGHFYDPVGALRDVVVNHLMQVVAAAAMEPPSRGDPRHAQGRAGGALPRRSGRPTRRTTSAASTTATVASTASPRTRRPRRTPRCGSRSRTGAGRACRSSSGPASACR